MRINHFPVERNQRLVGLGSTPQIQRCTQVLDYDHVAEEVGRHSVVAPIVADQFQHGAADTITQRQGDRHSHRDLRLDGQSVAGVKNHRAGRSSR